MSIHLQRELDRLTKYVLGLSEQVESAVQIALHAMRTRDASMARKLELLDEEIDQLEVDLEEACLKSLALYQPVAQDLRYIVAILKINNDLERIGDLAVNIAERAVFLANKPPIKMPHFLGKMADRVLEMLRKSLHALPERNAKEALSVCAMDDEVDGFHRRMHAYVAKTITEGREDPDSVMNLLSTSRYLERIADHATNIAEDVIYLVAGQIVRHKAVDLSVGKPASKR